MKIFKLLFFIITLASCTENKAPKAKTVIKEFTKIVKDDNIISIGQTSIKGRPHAEYNAIKNSTENLENSIMYVTLEPCNHHGVTRPCTNEIIKSKTRGISLDKNSYAELVKNLEISEKGKDTLKKLTPINYLGIAQKLSKL